MPKSIKDMLKRLVLVISIISITLVPFFVNNNEVQAASLTSLYDTMTRLKISVAANHDINFTTPTGVSEGETITVTFPAAFNTASIIEDDVDVEDDTVDLTTAATCAGTENASVAMASDILTITICAGDGGAIAATSVVTVEIGTNATASGTGSNQITNPGSSGSNIISIGGTMTDSGTMAVAIMTEDQVTVSATVDASITSTLSASTCALGTLSSSTIETCTYTNTVNTNASGGFTSTILDDGNLRDGANDINDTTGNVDAGSEEYGVGTSDAGNTITQYTACADPEPTPLEASALTTTAQSYSTDAGPVSNDITTLCHGASILPTTPAGSYSHITTHITTGTF